MKTNVIYNKDCLIGIKELPDNSIDLVATDPPYGIGFMGKHWDKALPSVTIWKECLRVLKPGAFAFVMCIPRQDCLARMIVSLEDAGFVVGFTSMYHCFASGFPKAQNIGKAVDKRLGVEREIIAQNPNVRKSHKGHILELGLKQEGLSISVTPQAKALDGSYGGFQPKPAVEVILVAMKPLSEKTYVDQALANRKGISWLDDGRILYESKEPNLRKNKGKWTQENVELWGNKLGQRPNPNNQGRFPANLLCSDDVLNDGKEHKPCGIYKDGRKLAKATQDAKIRTWDRLHSQIDKYQDSGSFSRYFSLDAWFAKKLETLPAGVHKTFPFLIVPKASKAEKNRGCKKNIHPTCKPIKLMSYLITLGSRQGDIVLDPFMGSGTTLIAAKILNRHYIGYDTNSEYCKITRARLRVEDTLFNRKKEESK